MWKASSTHNMNSFQKYKLQLKVLVVMVWPSYRDLVAQSILQVAGPVSTRPLLQERNTTTWHCKGGLQ